MWKSCSFTNAYFLLRSKWKKNLFELLCTSIITWFGVFWDFFYNCFRIINFSLFNLKVSAKEYGLRLFYLLLLSIIIYYDYPLLFENSDGKKLKFSNYVLYRHHTDVDVTTFTRDMMQRQFALSFQWFHISVTFESQMLKR